MTSIFNEGNGDFLGELDTSKIGTWKITYTATDSAGHKITTNRIIDVVDPLAPIITLSGEAEITQEGGPDFQDPGATVADADGVALDAEASSLIVWSTQRSQAPTP